MTPEHDWSPLAAESAVPAATGALKLALVFGSAAIALALIVAPLAERQAGEQYAAEPAGLDTMSTGSISRGGGPSGNYTIRRSVLQADPNAVCIIRPNGIRSGDC